MGRELFVAASVRLHGARPWHLEENGESAFCSGKRETPRRKAVGIWKRVEREKRERSFVAASVRLHGARPWHLEERERALFSSP
jgi:hypothetical protein